MIEERDLAGFALPFAVGVASAYVFLPAGNTGLNAIIPASACILIGISTSVKPGSISPVLAWTFITILSCMAGIICCQTEKIISLSPSATDGLLVKATSSWCESLKHAIDSIPFVHGETSAIIKALLTGDRLSISKETAEAFRASGASHILALSGMHLGVIYGIVRKALVIIGNSPASRRARAAVCISVCGLYTMATGSGDSITRAFLFILIRETSAAMHRPSGLRTTLLASLIIQLASRPASIGSIGFQLSYAAMAGIAYIHPVMKGFWPEGNGGGIMVRIWETASLSISCQLTTGPLAWYHFNTFPKHFILTNMIAMPLTGIIIPASLLTLLLHSLDICPDIMIKATERIVISLSAALEIIASM